MTINLAWPRQEIYDPEGTSPVLQFFGLIVIAFIDWELRGVFTAGEGPRFLPLGGVTPRCVGG